MVIGSGYAEGREGVVCSGLFVQGCADEEDGDTYGDVEDPTGFRQGAGCPEYGYSTLQPLGYFCRAKAVANGHILRGPDSGGPT